MKMESKKKLLPVLSVALMLSAIIPIYAQEPPRVQSPWQVQRMFHNALKSVNIRDYWSLSDDQVTFLSIFRNALVHKKSDKAIQKKIKKEGFTRDPKIMNNQAIVGAAAYLYYHAEPSDEQIAAFRKKFFPKRWWQFHK